MTGRTEGIVGYVRVSTEELASSGLGLEACSYVKRRV